MPEEVAVSVVVVEVVGVCVDDSVVVVVVEGVCDGVCV